MSLPFASKGRLILVRAVLDGPNRPVLLRLALDTGATITTISRVALQDAGYNLDAIHAQSRVMTGSGAEVASRVPVQRLVALGFERTSHVVLALTLPRAIQVDGLLGLDFLRDHRLTIDFRAGLLTLD